METKLTKNPTLLKWLDEKVELLKPSEIVWIDGSKEQIDALKAEAVKTGEMIKLNDELLPDCYLHRTAENDVARVEAHLSAQLKKKMQVLQTIGWTHRNATRCFMTLLPAHIRAEQCILSLTQWVLLPHLSLRLVLRLQTPSMLYST